MIVEFLQVGTVALQLNIATTQLDYCNATIAEIIMTSLECDMKFVLHPCIKCIYHAIMACISDKCKVINRKANKKVICVFRRLS